ncbi:MAG: hypothetical protein ACTSWA_04140 [Candidatus Thorarchaeota archaeon]
MNVDKALAKFAYLWYVDGGDTGRRRVEHRNFLQLSFSHHIRTGQEKGIDSQKYINEILLIL